MEPQLGERIEQDVSIYLGRASVIGLKNLEGEIRIPPSGRRDRMARDG